MESLENWISESVVHNRLWIMVLTFVLVAIAGIGVRDLGFNDDIRVWFSKHDPQLIAFDELENTYTKSGSVIFVITPRNGNVFTSNTLAAIESLTSNAWQIPYSNRVDSITNFQHSKAEQDDLIVENLVTDAETLSDSQLEDVSRVALSEPLLINRLLSPDGSTSGINVNIIRPGISSDELEKITKVAQKLADEFIHAHPDIDLRLTGEVIIDNAFVKATQDDMSTLVPVMFLAIAIVAGVLLRSILGVISIIIVITLSVSTAMGFAGWLGILLNPASGNAPTIILTLAVADSIHILVTVLHAMRKGVSKTEAIKKSMRVNLYPIFLTSMTTAIGFASMHFAEAPPFHDLGTIVVIGTLAAFVYSVFFLPALLTILPLKVTDSSSGVSSRNVFGELADFVVSKQNILFFGLLAVTLFISTGIPRIVLDDNFIKYFDERYEVRKASDFMEDNLTGLDAIEYSINSGETGGISNPEYLRAVENFANWFREQPGVVHVNSITDIVKRLNKNMHGDDETYNSIPAIREMTAQFLLLYEMSLPLGLDLNNQINIDKSAARFTVTLSHQTAAQLREIELKSFEWLKANAPEYMLAKGAGLSIMFAHISERNINSMLKGSFLALILISGILIFALRSIKLGILSLVPNLLPAFITFGIWGLLVGQVGLAASVLVGITIGIVVDDTVHFMSNYLRARRYLQMTPENAVRYAFRTVGQALWATTLILIAGFGILATSGYLVTSEMGLLTAITLGVALLMDLFFLPTLLMRTDKSMLYHSNE